MEYKLKSAKLQNIVTATEQLFAAASDLGTIDSGTLLIPVEQIKADLTAADVFFAINLTDNEVLTPSISAGNLVLTKPVDGEDLVAATKIHLVIKLK